MVNLLTDPLLQHVVALALAALFGTAAWHKWAAQERFSLTLQEYGLPQSGVGFVAVALAGVETLLCIGLTLPGTRRLAAVGAIVVLLAYGLALARAVTEGRSIADCGCGPGAPQPVHATLVVRNLLLAAAAGSLLPVPATRGLAGADGLVGVVAIATFAVLYAALNTLLANQPGSRWLAAGEGGEHG